MALQLRSHQLAAGSSIASSLAEGQRPVAQLATGTGKSLIIADLARETAGVVWILHHVQELVTQNAETYAQYTGNSPGVLCSGLNRADYGNRVTFATVQSLRRPALEGKLPTPGLIIVDEAHRVPHKTGEMGMFESVFAAYPNVARAGLTATPWRTDDGAICGKGPEFWFDDLCYRYTVPQAVADGWLCPVIGVETEHQLDLEDVETGAEFSAEQIEERETQAWLNAAARSVVELAAKRKHVSVYCSTVRTARRTALALAQVSGDRAEVLTGATAKAQRGYLLDEFKAGGIRFLVSVDTLTTGFNFPALDCIVCLRPTVSSSLWVQMAGRGTRIYPGKKNCLLLDMVGNLQRLGGVDVLDTYYRQRGGAEPEQLEAVPRERKTRRVLPGVRTLAVIDPMTGAQASEGAELWVQVHSVNCVPLQTRRGPALLVQYAATTPEGARIDASAFISTERPTPEVVAFFVRRGLAVRLPCEPRKVTWQVKGAPHPAYVKVRKAGRYWNVTQEKFDE